MQGAMNEHLFRELAVRDIPDGAFSDRPLPPIIRRERQRAPKNTATTTRIVLLVLGLCILAVAIPVLCGFAAVILQLLPLLLIPPMPD
jgi:hypothetical protein